MKHTQITTGRRLVSILTALLLILAMTAAALPQEAWAATGETFDDGNLMYGVTDEDGKTVEVTDTQSRNITKADIPATVEHSGKTYAVTSIGYNAFQDRENLQSVTIPNSVTSIKDNAFNGCSNLSTITGMDKVETIGYSTFKDCSSLTSITIPDSVTAIKNDSFNGCSNLSTITGMNKVESIGNNAFENCSSLTEFTIPDSVTSITDSAFNGCSKLTEFKIAGNNTVFSVHDGVLFCDEGKTLFLYPPGKQGSYTVPDSVTSIGEHAFSGCSKLTSIAGMGKVESIGYFAFSDCSSLESVTIGDSVATIGQGAFVNCSGLISITGMGRVKTIGGNAFKGCSSLTSVTIPDSVTSINNGAFSGCSSLTSVLVMFGVDPKDKTINEKITNAISNNDITWYRGWRSFAGNTADIIDITVTPGDSYNLYASLGIIDTIYENQTGEKLYEGTEITIPAFTLSGNTSTGTKLSDDGQTLKLGTDETGTLLLKTYGKTIRVNGYQPPAVSYWCTLTADALSFPEMEAGDTPQSQSLQLHCSGSTGASITKVALSGTDFLLDDSKAEAYVSPGKTNTTYRIMPKAGLAPGSYKATVTVTYSYGKTAEADVTLTVTEATQEAPAKLTAKSKNYQTIALSWTAASRAEKYQVYRATKKNGTYKRITVTSKTSLNNIKLATGKTYYYKVRAYRTAGGKKAYSPFTKIISAVPKPSAPSFSLKAGKGRITVSWKGVSGATGYRLYRASSKNGKFVLVKDSRSKARNCTSTGLRSKKTYYYKLRAYRIVNGKKIYSSYTKVKTIKTK